MKPIETKIRMSKNGYWYIVEIKKYFLGIFPYWQTLKEYYGSLPEYKSTRLFETEKEAEIERNKIVKKIEQVREERILNKAKSQSFIVKTFVG